jgi:hypothetical protein
MEKHNSLVASFLLFFKVSVLRLADEQPAALFLQAAHQSRKPLSSSSASLNNLGKADVLHFAFSLFSAAGAVPNSACAEH